MQSKKIYIRIYFHFNNNNLLFYYFGCSSGSGSCSTRGSHKQAQGHSWRGKQKKTEKLRFF